MDQETKEFFDSFKKDLDQKFSDIDQRFMSFLKLSR